MTKRTTKTTREMPIKHGVLFTIQLLPRESNAHSTLLNVLVDQNLHRIDILFANASGW